MRPNTAAAYIEAIEDKQIRMLMEKVRSVVKMAIPEAEESFKMGQPCYTIGKSIVSSIADYRSHVNLYFPQGAKLASALLEGAGKGMRHIKIETVSDIHPEEFIRLLKEAAANAQKPGN
jgi:hypothetical protein